MTTEAHLKAVSFDQITGWRFDNVDRAFVAFRRSCEEILGKGKSFLRVSRWGGSREDWMTVCKTAQAMDPHPTVAGARDFFEQHFRPFYVVDNDRPEGLITGYFEPEVVGSRIQTEAYNVPLYGKPSDLIAFNSTQEQRTGLRYGRIVSGVPMPYFNRQQIESGSLVEQHLEIAWLASWPDAFFIHVQGSGRVHLNDGGVMRLAFSAKNGHPYTSIGALLVQRAEISPADLSMQTIRRWMSLNPEKARKLMWENKSFVFFREVKLDDANLGPPGAQHVNLTPERSLAVDRSVWALGTPLWLDTDVPQANSEVPREFRHLMIAQDTGSAIKGIVRGDIFFGSGELAAWSAGHLKSKGRMIALLPVALSARLVQEGNNS